MSDRLPPDADLRTLRPQDEAQRPRDDALLVVENLQTRFKTRDGYVHAVNGVSLRVAAGETLGIVGESGCGKSVTMMSLLGLIPQPPGEVVAGTAHYAGRDLLQLDEDELRRLRGAELAMIFQDPMTSFNPVRTIGWQVAEPLMIHRGLSREEADAEAVRMMELVGISNAAERLNNYPHQFSGGMRQRVMIAMALICSPKILIADEPTTALDVTIQAQIVDLVKRLQAEFKMAVIWITHDLGVIAGMADRVAVMYAGFVIETAAVDDLYAHPQHPYTLGLLGSLPRLDADERQRLTSIDGLPPVLMEMPRYCPFIDRCPYAVEKCAQANPPLLEVGPGHGAACWVDLTTGEVRP
jgi:oligopeptide transport system ATP-binding protein